MTIAHFERTVLAREVSRATFLWRLTHGLTQQQLAELLELKQSQVARIESGDVNPTIETLQRLSARIGVDFAIEVVEGELRVSATRRD